MKITLISRDEFESKYQSLHTESERARFSYGLRYSNLLGGTYLVLVKAKQPLSWREPPIAKYLIRDPRGYFLWIPEWFVLNIEENEEEEDGDTDEDHDYYG